MAKQIKFEYEGIEYTLEFTKKTISQMEAEGFIVSQIGEKPMTLLPRLFAGAFKAHHRFTKRDIIDKIFSDMPNKDLLMDKLADMYNDPLESLLEDPEDSKKVEWVTSWE